MTYQLSNIATAEADLAHAETCYRHCHSDSYGDHWRQRAAAIRAAIASYQDWQRKAAAAAARAAAAGLDADPFAGLAA